MTENNMERPDRKTGLLEKLGPFLHAAGDSIGSQTTWACVLNSILEPAGSAGCGVCLMVEKDDTVKSVLWDILHALMRQSLPDTHTPTAIFTDTCASTELYPVYGAESKTLGTPGACSHVAVIFAKTNHGCVVSDRTFGLYLPAHEIRRLGRAGKNELKAIASTADGCAAITEWIKELSFDKTTGTCMGIREILDGRLYRNVPR